MPAAAVLLAISIADVLRDFGYAGLAVLMVVENVFPPIPSEAVLPLAGYFVGRGELSFPLVLATATAGSVGGSVILYELARAGGRPFARRFLKFARQDPDRLERAEEWFDRRGAVAVLLGRCVPGVRSVIALPAGVLRMRRAKYILLTTLGTAVWNTALIGAGWLLGREWGRVSDVLGGLATPLLIVAAVAAAGLLVWWSLRRRRAEGSGG